MPLEQLSVRCRKSTQLLQTIARHGLAGTAALLAAVGGCAQGDGLGLAATAGIVRGHRGALRVHSQPGQGTTFRVYFPPHAGEILTRAQPLGGKLPTHASVLVIDDEPMVLEVVRSALSRVGARCATFAEARRALAEVEQDPMRYNVALLDISMPGMDGRTCMRLLRKLRPDLRVVLSSGYDESQDPVMANAYTWFLKKPYTVAALLQALRIALAPDHTESGT